MFQTRNSGTNGSEHIFKANLGSTTLNINLHNISSILKSTGNMPIPTKKIREYWQKYRKFYKKNQWEHTKEAIQQGHLS